MCLHSRERATISLSAESSEDEVRSPIRHLRVNGRFTPSIIIRAVCMGDLEFFEYTLAELSDITVVSARILIHNSGAPGLQGVFNRAGLPPDLLSGGTGCHRRLARNPLRWGA